MDDFDDDDAHEGEWDDDEFEFDCHMGPDGQCGAAGSEMCDFECPVMAQIHHENAEARRRAAERKRSRGGRQSRIPLT